MRGQAKSNSDVVGTRSESMRTHTHTHTHIVIVCATEPRTHELNDF